MSTDSNKHIETCYCTPAREPNKADTFNKSRAIIAGLRANDPVVERKVFSYDSEYGILRILKNLLYSENTPKCVKDFFYEQAAKGEDPVLYLATDLVAKGIFSPQKLSASAARFDGSFFFWVRTIASNHLIDVYHKLKNMPTDNLEDYVAGKPDFTLGDKLAADENLTTENSLLSFDIESFIAGLPVFQIFIYHMALRGYTPQQIVRQYSKLQGKPYTMNYYYSQKSKLKAAIENYFGRAV